MASKIISFPDPPFQWRGHSPRPVYYCDTTNNKEYFIVSPHSANDDKIWRFDIAQHKYDVVCVYPPMFQPKAHAMILIQDKHELHLFSSLFGQDMFGIFNLKT